MRRDRAIRGSIIRRPGRAMAPMSLWRWQERGRLISRICLGGNLRATIFWAALEQRPYAPGLALWALSEIAALRPARGTAERIWPDVQRKVGLIMRMLDATADVRQPFIGPVMPALAGDPTLDLVAYAHRDGLIDGRMEFHPTQSFL